MNDGAYLQRITLFLVAMRRVYEEVRPGQDHIIIPEDVDAFTSSVLETRASNPFANAFLCTPGVVGLRCIEFPTALTLARSAGLIHRFDRQILIRLSPRQAREKQREPHYPQALELARAYAKYVGILPRENKAMCTA